MSKTILIIYPYVNQEPMVFNLITSLREIGLNIDAINSFNLQFAAKPLQNISKIHRIIPVISKVPLPKWKGALFKMYNRKKALMEIASKYDIIDFHSFIADYDMLINELSSQKIIKITYWGSDFYRASCQRIEQQRIILSLVDSIQIGTETMKNDIMKCFPEFEDKVRIANFGIQQFDVISELKKTDYSPRFKNGEYRNKLMVVCGYNGSKAQQHLIMIEALEKLQIETKNSILLVLPMTYGAESMYLKLVETALKKTKINHIILIEHLTELDVAKLRIETDIVVNIQKTDAFSGSLQQHLFSENMVLVGDWLPYDVLDDHKVYFKRTKIENLSENIADCIINFENISKLTTGNCEKMGQISSIKITAQRIASIYKELQV